MLSPEILTLFSFKIVSELPNLKRNLCALQIHFNFFIIRQYSVQFSLDHASINTSDEDKAGKTKDAAKCAILNLYAFRATVPTTVLES